MPVSGAGDEPLKAQQSLENSAEIGKKPGKLKAFFAKFLGAEKTNKFSTGWLGGSGKSTGKVHITANDLVHSEYSQQLIKDFKATAQNAVNSVKTEDLQEASDRDQIKLSDGELKAKGFSGSALKLLKEMEGEDTNDGSDLVRGQEKQVGLEGDLTKALLEASPNEKLIDRVDALYDQHENSEYYDSDDALNLSKEIRNEIAQLKGKIVEAHKNPELQKTLMEDRKELEALQKEFDGWRMADSLKSGEDKKQIKSNQSGSTGFEGKVDEVKKKERPIPAARRPIPAPRTLQIPQGTSFSQLLAGELSKAKAEELQPPKAGEVFIDNSSQTPRYAQTFTWEIGNNKFEGTLYSGITVGEGEIPPGLQLKFAAVAQQMTNIAADPESSQDARAATSFTVTAGEQSEGNSDKMVVSAQDSEGESIAFDKFKLADLRKNFSIQPPSPPPRQVGGMGVEKVVNKQVEKELESVGENANIISSDANTIQEPKADNIEKNEVSFDPQALPVEERKLALMGKKYNDILSTEQDTANSLERLETLADSLLEHGVIRKKQYKAFTAGVREARVQSELVVKHLTDAMKEAETLELIDYQTKGGTEEVEIKENAPKMNKKMQNALHELWNTNEGGLGNSYIKAYGKAIQGFDQMNELSGALDSKKRRLSKKAIDALTPQLEKGMSQDQGTVTGIDKDSAWVRRNLKTQIGGLAIQLVQRPTKHNLYIKEVMADIPHKGSSENKKTAAAFAKKKYTDPWTKLLDTASTPPPRRRKSI